VCMYSILKLTMMTNFVFHKESVSVCTDIILIPNRLNGYLIKKETVLSWLTNYNIRRYVPFYREGFR